MHDRVLVLRKSLNLTQAEFAQKINLSRSAIANIEQGLRPITERTLADICREFDVNEDWLRNGNGPMFRSLSADEELTDFYKDLLGLPDNDLKKRFALAVSKMDQSQWDALEKFLDDLATGDI